MCSAKADLTMCKILVFCSPVFFSVCKNLVSTSYAVGSTKNKELQKCWASWGPILCTAVNFRTGNIPYFHHMLHGFGELWGYDRSTHFLFARPPHNHDFERFLSSFTSISSPPFNLPVFLMCHRQNNWRTSCLVFFWNYLQWKWSFCEPQGNLVLYELHRSCMNFIYSTAQNRFQRPRKSLHIPLSWITV